MKDAEKRIAYKKLTKDELIAKLIKAENYIVGQDILITLGEVFKVSKPDD